MWPDEFNANERYHKIWKEGENIAIRRTSEHEYDYFTIQAREFMKEIRKSDRSNWLLAAAGSYSSGNMSEFFKPEAGTLYVLPMHLESDRDLQLELKYPAALGHFGIAERQDVYIRPNDPPQIVYVYGDQDLPTVKLINPTEYTNDLAILCVRGGMKYTLTPIPKPQNFDGITVQGVLQ